jgi:Haem-binding domain
MVKKILIGLAALFVVIQFIRPAENNSNDESQSITTKYNVPKDVESILKSACYDCHSNNTTYPWYAKIQPVLWWLDHHIDEGKREVNFSAFTARRIAIQNKKFKEIAEQVETKEMPLPSYTYAGLHADANLTDAQRQTLIQWAKAQMDTLKANYPADSLVLKRPQGK